MAMTTPDGRLIILPHKHGTSYIVRALRAKFGDAARLVNPKHRHWPLHKIGASERSGRRVLGIARNPFAFYVSRWLYVKREVDRRIGPFPDVLREYLESHNGPFGNTLLDDIFPSGTGSYTRQHLAYHCESAREAWRIMQQSVVKFAAVSVMLRLEKLDDELGAEYGLTRSHLSQWRNSQPYGLWTDYYDADMRGMVERADGLILRTYNYEWESEQ